MTLGVGKPGRFDFGDRRSQPRRGQHLMQRHSRLNVVMDIAGSDQRQFRLLGKLLELSQPMSVVRSAEQLSQQVAAVAKDVSIDMRWLGLGPRSPGRGIASSATATWHHAPDQPLSVLRDVVERDLAGVEAALERLDDGTYWTDEVTGEPLSDELLAADPVARREA